MLADGIEDVTAFDAVDNHRTPTEQAKRVGHPISNCGVRIDIVRVYDVDIIIAGNAEKLGADRMQQTAVGHAAITADFLDVMDLDT